MTFRHVPIPGRAPSDSGLSAHLVKQGAALAEYEHHGLDPGVGGQAGKHARARPLGSRSSLAGHRHPLFSAARVSAQLLSARR